MCGFEEIAKNIKYSISLIKIMNKIGTIKSLNYYS